VLSGEANPHGLLPVTIPAADDPGRVLFPMASVELRPLRGGGNGAL
jgi:hypothetical protein